MLKQKFGDANIKSPSLPAPALLPPSSLLPPPSLPLFVSLSKRDEEREVLRVHFCSKPYTLHPTPYTLPNNLWLPAARGS